MRKSVLVALYFCALAVASADRYDVTIQLEGRNREFIVVTPDGVAPVEGYPIVFMLHGTSGDGLKFYNISGWKELVQPKQLIAVFPSSLRWCVNDDEGVAGQHQTTKWSNADLEGVACEGQTLVDDVAFFRKMVDTIAAFTSIDRRRVFASGFSNGGVMTSKLAMDAPDLFAAIATSAGPLVGDDSTRPASNIPLWFTVGSLDDRLISLFGIPEIPNNDSCLIYLFPLLRPFLGAFQLTQEYTREETPYTITYTFRTPIVGAPPALFLATLVKGLAHNYPNGDNYPVSAANVFWDFFMASTKLTDVHEDKHESVLTVAPNPASETVTLTLSTSDVGTDVRIDSAMGVEVGAMRSVRGTLTIDVHNYVQGVYFVRAGERTTSFMVNR